MGFKKNNKWGIRGTLTPKRRRFQKYIKGGPQG